MYVCMYVCIYIYISKCYDLTSMLVPGNARVRRSGKSTAIWSFRHCKPAACILGLAGADMRLSLICGFP